MPTAIVTGADSDVGHAFAALLIEKGYEVHAIDMTLSDQIQSLKCKHYQVDVTSPDSIALFKSQLGIQPVDLLLNVAGIMIRPELDDLNTTSLRALNISFAVNASAVILLTQALLSNILAAQNAKIGIVSSQAGSMKDNTSGGMYAYRASKAAANSIGVSLANDLREKGVMVLLLHPGISKTNFTGGLGLGGALEPRDTAERLFEVMNEKTIADSGKFFQYEGHELPW